MLKGFRDFILRGNIIDLAVAFVMGVAFTAVVTAFVNDIINPLISAIGGKPDLSEYYFTINGSRFLLGSFIGALISFVIIAAVLYFFVVRPVNALMIRVKGPTAVGTKECPYCMSTIPLGATRCPDCTSQLEATAAAS